jgi:hypothetical protein
MLSIQNKILWKIGLASGLDHKSKTGKECPLREGRIQKNPLSGDENLTYYLSNQLSALAIATIYLFVTVKVIGGNGLF